MLDIAKKNVAATAPDHSPEGAGLGSAAGPTRLDAAQDPFSTGHLLTGIKSRTISSGIVTSLAQIVQFGLNFASVMILARLLNPHDFGLVAMVTTITGFLRIFNEAGLSTATIQREGITHAQVSNLFWTNLALGGAISLLLGLSAPIVARFYHEPRLIQVTLALCLTFLITSSTVQHLALLKRQMRFKIVALIEVGAMFVGVLVGVIMALLQCDYWSLVGMQLTSPVVAFLLTWSLSRWRPQWPKRRSGTRSLLGFGANLTASSFLWSVARGSDALLIGRVYGSVSLGLYSRAGALLTRPLSQAMAPLEAIFVPTLSRLQAQPERYRRILFQIFEVVAVTGFLFSGLLLALANPLTLVVLGPKWKEAVPILAAFTLVAIYTPITCVAGWLLTSQGRGWDFLKMSSICSVVAVVAFLAGLRFGVVGVALSYSLSCLLIQMPVAYYIAGRAGPVNTTDLWSRFIKHLPIWVVVCGATWLVHEWVQGLAPVAQLVICAPTGLLAGGLFIWAYAPSRRVVATLLEVLRDWMKARLGNPPF